MSIIANITEVLTMLIIIRCLLSWFPNIRWYEQPFKLLDQIVEPMILPFRRLIPPLGGFDLSPIAALLVLQLIRSLLMHSPF